MTTRGSQTITWDEENRPLTVTGGASFVYDGDGNRVKKTENSVTVLYANKYYGASDETTEIRYCQLLATNHVLSISFKLAEIPVKLCCVKTGSSGETLTKCLG